MAEKTTKEIEDCFPCRLVGGGGCIGASLYVGYHAKNNNHPVGRTVTFMFAGGINRIFILC